MKSRMIVPMLVLSLMLVACSRFKPAPMETPTEVASLTPTVLPTHTEVPPSPTVTPTPTEVPPTPTPTPAYPTEGYGPDNFPENVNPLTGLAVADPNMLKRRPLAIKVNIIPRDGTRPPWGLSLADLVFEYYHNGGYARFHAIFFGSEADSVGPIRSGRFLDDSLVRMYKSIFVYGGADPRIEYRFFSGDYVDRLVREGETSLCPPKPEAPLCRFDHTGYDFLLAGTRETRQYAVSRGANDDRQNLNGMFFQLQLPQGGEPGRQATIRFSGDNYTRWEYDQSSEAYLRSQDNVFDQGAGEVYTPLLDRLNDQQLTAKNVVVLLVPHSFYLPPPVEIVEILLSGSGPAYAFRDGQAFQLTWNRPTADSVLYLTFPDGSRYPFAPGNTWFEVVGQTTIITQPEAASWRFVMFFP